MTPKLYYVYESTFNGNQCKIVSKIFTNKKDAEKELKTRNANGITYNTFLGVTLQDNFFMLGWQWDDEHGRLEIEFAKDPEKYTPETRRWRHSEIDRKQRQSTAF